MKYAKFKPEVIYYALVSCIIVFISISKTWSSWNSLWLDEILSIANASAPTIKTLLNDSIIEGIPLGFQFWNYLWWKIGGFTLLKIITLLASVIALFETCRLTKGISSSTIFLCFIALSNYFIIHCGEIRPYVYLFIFYTWSLKLIENCLITGKLYSLNTLLYALVSLVGISFHYTYSIVVLIQLLTLIPFLSNKKRTYPIIIGLFIILIASPFYYRFWLLMSSGIDLWGFIPGPTGNIIVDHQDLLKTLFQTQFSNYFHVFITIILIASTILFIRRKNKHFLDYQLISGVIFTPTIIYFVSLAFQSLLIDRYYSYLLFCVFLFISRQIGSILKPNYSVTILIFILCGSLYLLRPLQPYYTFKKDTREWLNYIDEISSPCFLVMYPADLKFARSISALTNHEFKSYSLISEGINQIESDCSTSEQIILVKFIPLTPEANQVKSYLDSVKGTAIKKEAGDLYLEVWNNN